ncbi:hypothetical protein pdam_00011563, partial [Paramuricea clavata]
MNELRAHGNWIINGNTVVRRFISECITCRRLRGTTAEQNMADLPQSRLEDVLPFTYSAVDYFGPWYVIKEGRKEVKRYGALFTCMAGRAIHIDVTHSMETDSFIQALRRFTCRRGAIRELRSDRGTNFIGAENELNRAVEEMDDDKIKAELLKDGIDWIKNPAKAMKNQWPMARVTNVKEDDQGLLRSATVRTASGSTLDRPINKLVELLVESSEEEPEKTG